MFLPICALESSEMMGWQPLPQAVLVHQRRKTLQPVQTGTARCSHPKLHQDCVQHVHESITKGPHAKHVFIVFPCFSRLFHFPWKVWLSCWNSTRQKLEAEKPIAPIMCSANSEWVGSPVGIVFLFATLWIKALLVASALKGPSKKWDVETVWAKWQNCVMRKFWLTNLFRCNSPLSKKVLITLWLGP